MQTTTTIFTTFNDDILQNWKDRGIQYVSVVHLESEEPYMYGDENAIWLTPSIPFKRLDWQNQLSINSAKVYDYADNDIDGYIYLVHERDCRPS